MTSFPDPFAQCAGLTGMRGNATKSEEEEFEFWSTHDSTDYVDWDNAMVNPSFANLKPSTKSISIRMPLSMLNEIKRLANQKDIAYQALIKVYLADRLEIERRKAKRDAA